MNVFNRIAMILLLMVFIVILAIIVVSTMFFPVQVVEWVRQGADTLEVNLILTNRLIVFVAGALLLIFCTLLLWLEVRRGRARNIRVQRISGGEAQLAIESIARRVEYNIEQLADIIKAKPTVIRRGKAVEVRLDLETNPDIEVPMKTEEVCVVTREVVEDQMGLRLSNVKVNIKHAPFPKEKKKPWDWQRRELPRPVDLPVGEPEEVVPIYTAPVAEVQEVEEVARPAVPPEEEVEEIIEAEVAEAPPLPPFPAEMMEEVAEEEKPPSSPFARLKNLFVKEAPAPEPEAEWLETIPPYEEAEIAEALVTPPPAVPEVEEVAVEEMAAPVYPPFEEVEMAEEVPPPPIPEMEVEEEEEPSPAYLPLEEVEVAEEPVPSGFEAEQDIVEEEVMTPLEEAEEAFPLAEEAAEPEEAEIAMPPSALEEEEEASPDEMAEAEGEEEIAPSSSLEADLETEEET